MALLGVPCRAFCEAKRVGRQTVVCGGRSCVCGFVWGFVSCACECVLDVDPSFLEREERLVRVYRNIIIITAVTDSNNNGDETSSSSSSTVLISIIVAVLVVCGRRSDCNHHAYRYAPHSLSRHTVSTSPATTVTVTGAGSCSL